MITTRTCALRLAAASWPAILAATTVTALTAQQPHTQAITEYAAAQRAVERALVADSSLADADHVRDALLELRGRCDGPDRQRCRNLVNFTLGFAHQRQASGSPDARRLLEAAAAYYAEVTDGGPARPVSNDARDPVVADAVFNTALLYRQLGSHEWQEPFYLSAPHADPQRQALHYTFQGDYFFRLGNWSRALTAYMSAVTHDPDAYAAREAIIDVFRKVDEVQASQLLAMAEEWEARFPDLAARAWLAVAEKTRERDPRSAEHAVTQYVGSSSFDPHELDRLPAGWQPTMDLARYVADPTNASAAGWWLDDADRREALARVSVRLGQAALASGEPERAERILAAFPTGPVMSTNTLDLSRELALLYHHHPRLDPDGSRFDQLEMVLFRGKGRVLQSRDLTAAQRYHTVLGRIYAERGVWTSSSRGRNAVDQLSWALQTAEQRRHEQGVHQPLPELRRLLADGLTRTGKPEEARREQLRAAIDFLDLDDTVQASAAALDAGAAARHLMPLIELRGHDAPRNAVNDRCDPGRVDAALEAARAAGDAFVARQRFKVLADCAALVAPTERARYGAEAMALLAGGDVALSGGADLLRLDRAAVLVQERATLPDLETDVDYGPATGASEPRIPFSLDTRAGAIVLPRDVLIAAQVVSLLGDRSDVRIDVHDGVVRIPQDAGIAPDVARIRGVRSVVPKPQ